VVEQKTTVVMSSGELQALLELAGLAVGRMSTAEQLYYDALLSRFAQELAGQSAAAEGIVTD
jgi:hypothetical protein